MIIDNLLVNSLKKEFSEKLVSGRIEKIYQPDKDSFVIHIWNNSLQEQISETGNKRQNKTYKLVISLNSGNYRINLSNKNFHVSNQHSTFCLHLKKALESGIITEVNQINFDRIIEFKIEGVNNVRDKVNFYLIAELTGKYSNLILLNEDYNVLGSYKFVDDTQNEERQILLSKKYYPITNKSNKLELENLNYESFTGLINNSELSIKKFLVNNFLGISTHTAQIIIKKTEIPEVKAFSLSETDKNRLYEFLKYFSEIIKEDKINLNFFKSEKGIDFDLADETVNSPSEIIDNYYQEKDDQNRFDTLKNELIKIVKKNLDKYNERIKYQEDVLEKSEQADLYKQYGDLLFSNLHNFPDNYNSITVEDYYNQNTPLTITLNENLSISENAQLFYKKYNKLRNSEEASLKLIDEYTKEADYLEQVMTSIDSSENLDDLREIELELIEEKYIIKVIKKQVKKYQLEKSHLLSLTSNSGLEIIVGKNNKQNDFLTTKYASENDIWLHTRLIPGSHVVLRTENGQKQFSDEDIKEAAIMAAKYSKAKYSSNVCVIYTKIKNVKKPAHAKPGLVIYSKEKAIYVTP